MALSPTGILRPEETIRNALGTLGVELVYEDNPLRDDPDVEAGDSWMSSVELVSPIGGAIQASWERLPGGEMLASAALPNGEPSIELYYRNWGPDGGPMTIEFHLADVATPEMAAVVMASVHRQHMGQADSITGTWQASRFEDILAQVAKVTYGGDSKDELDDAREAASTLIEMAGFDLDDSDGMGQPMGTNVLALLMSACHLVPQMRDRILGRTDDVRIEAVDL